MPDSGTGRMGASIAGLRFVESLASRDDTLLHRISPSTKIAATFIYIVAVVSFGQYDVSGILPFLAYPAIAAPIARIPFSLLLKRSAVALPFVVFAGIANLVFDKAWFALPFGFAVPAGAVSFFVLIIKALLTVSSALILAATTPINNIASGMRRFGLPCVVVLQFVLTCRYIEVILNEAARILHAYMLRSPGQKLVRFRDWPMLIARLFLLGIDRAERIYGAMLCRGFNARYAFHGASREPFAEILFVTLFGMGCIILRFFNPGDFLGRMICG